MTGNPHNITSEKRLGAGILLNLFITVTELLGGLFSNSLALISDAIHNLSDALALILAFVAQHIGRKKGNAKQTFGYKRSEILAAFVNAVVLIALSLFLIYKAMVRFSHPQTIQGGIMFWVALMGLVANLATVILLHKDASGSLNIRSAYLHLLSDTFSSLAVIIGAVIIRFFNLLWLDPLLTIMISIYIAKETYGILKEAISILMESTPANIKIESVKQKLESVPGIKNIHHIHFWSISDHETHFQCHADLTEDLSLSECDKIRLKMEQILLNDFPIHHITIQMEYDSCPDKSLVAEVSDTKK